MVPMLYVGAKVTYNGYKGTVVELTSHGNVVCLVNYEDKKCLEIVEGNQLKIAEWNKTIA